MDLREGQTGTAPDGTRVIVRGGQIVPLAAPSGRKPAPAEWGAGSYVLPNGDVYGAPGPRGGQPPKLGTITQDGSIAADLKEYQIKAGSQAVLMDQALTDYDQARRQGYNPASVKNSLAAAAEDVWAVGPWVADVIRDNPSERGRAAELQYTEGALRALTGAAATDSETRRTSRNMFRQPGESDAVEPNKARVRERFAGSIKTAAGPAYRPAPAAKPGARPVPAPARAAYETLLKGGQIDRSKPLGSVENPYLARDAATASKLRKGSYVILPDGSLARKDR